MSISQPFFTSTPNCWRLKPQTGNAWNETRPQCAYRLFEEQAERTPDMVVIGEENQQQTYDQVNRRANRWARLLIDRGVYPGARIALLIEQSTAWLTAMLAIWKAGKVLLPLTPTMPRWRVAQMLDDSGAVLVLTEDQFVPFLTSALNLLPQQSRMPFFYLDELEQLAQAQCNLPNLCLPTDPAYIAYNMMTLTGIQKRLVDHCSLAHSLSLLNPEHQPITHRQTDQPLIFSQSPEVSRWHTLTRFLMSKPKVRLI